MPIPEGYTIVDISSDYQFEKTFYERFDHLSFALEKHLDGIFATLSKIHDGGMTETEVSYVVEYLSKMQTRFMEMMRKAHEIEQILYKQTLDRPMQEQSMQIMQEQAMQEHSMQEYVTSFNVDSDKLVQSVFAKNPIEQFIVVCDVAYSKPKPDYLVITKEIARS